MREIPPKNLISDDPDLGGPAATPLPANFESFESVLAATLARAQQFLSSVARRPVARTPAPFAVTPLPEVGVGFDAALAQFEQRWAPGLSGSAGPRYLGFVTGGATPAALAGDWLTSVFDQNPTSGLDSSAPDLEREVLGWLRSLFGFDASHDGALVSGATMSNFVGLAIGREWLGEQRGISVADDGAAALGPVRVLSASPHSSIYKALSMLGLGRRSLVRVPAQPDREAVDLAALEALLEAAPDAPTIVVANAGTVNTVDFDDLSAIVALRSRYKFWLHVDAAFGAFAALLPEAAKLVAGLDQADSVCIDLHKWLNVPYDSAVQYSRRADLQARVFMNAAAYLGAPGDRPDFVHLTPENSRRFRALAVWFALSAYGRRGHAAIVGANIAQAARLGARLAQALGFRLLAPVRMNVVCFTLADDPSEARIAAFVRAVRDSGEAFVTATHYAGVWGLRAAFSNWRTTDADVDRVAVALEAALLDLRVLS